MSPIISFRACSRALLFIFSLLACITQLHAANLSIQWDSNSEPDLSGYRVYYGGTSGSRANTLDVGMATQATISNLSAGQTYYFVVTAYDTGGSESSPSNEISYAVPSTNQAPTVALTSPAEGNSYIAPASVTFTSTASDADGSIAKVEYFNGATKLGQATTSPYSFTWNSVPGGNYSVRAVATDNMGATASSAVVNFAVVVMQTNQAPSVSIASNGTTFVAPASISFTANASDSDGTVSRVEYFSAATKLGETTVSPYSFTWSSVPAGNYSVIAKATDNQGAVGTSTPVNIVVSGPNTAPTIADVGNQTVNEDASTGAIAFTVGDAESTAGSLVVSGSSSNPTLVPNGNIVFGGSGASRTVMITPAANQSGSATITLNVTDGQASASDTFLLTVNAVNDAPTISDIANQTVAANMATGALNFTVGDAETAAGTLVLSGNSSNPSLVPIGNIVFGGSGASRTVTVTPASNQTGTTTITVTVNDGIASTNDTFVLTVNAPVTGGLVAAYGFNEGTGTSVVDVSGNANNGAIGTATWTTSGKYGSALSFNGTSSRVTVNDTNSLDLTTGMTLEAWVYPTANGGWRDVIYKGVDDIYYLMSSSDSSAPAVGGTFAANAVRGTSALPLNAWSHLAGTYDGTTLRFYVNGVQVSSQAQSGSIQTSTAALTIGSDSLYGQYFAGRIDEVRIYNRALSTTEIQTDMNTPIGGTPPTNVAPTISDIVDRSTSEDTAASAVAFTVGDAETAAGSLVVSGSSNNPALVPNGNIVFGGSGASRTVTVTPAANQSGTATITVSVSDGQASATDTFVLTVNAVNDVPMIGDVADQTIAANTATNALSFTVGDIETAAGSLTMTGTSSNSTLVPNGNIVFGGSGANRTVTVTPAANQSGTATIALSVSDGQASATDTFVLTVTPPNQSPSVTLTSSGSSFLAPASYTITANASDADGTVAKIEFYTGSTKVGEKTAAPFTWTFSNVAAGNYSHYAIAVDNSGATSTSNAVAVAVAGTNSAPIVSLTSPQGGATFNSPATVNLAASASDSDGTIARVEFFSGSTLLGTSTTAPYSYAWIDVPGGVYNVRCVAYDNLGASATSATAKVTVNASPVVSVAVTGNFTAGGSMTITATASDSDGSIRQVEFYSGSVLLGKDKSSPYRFVWNNLPAGTHTITAVAYDNKNASTRSAAVMVGVAASSQAPVVSTKMPTVRAVGTGYEGTFEIEVLGEAGQMYDVWASQDLTNWSLMSSVLNAEGSVIVTDSSETPQKSRFYRVSLR